MVREKGPDIAVRALAEVPKAYLWLAGAGSYEDAVKELAAQMGVSARIRFLGWRDDVHALLKTADFFVRTSRSEGAGYVLEAFSNGVPVISARSIDTDRLIANGRTGLLVAKEDPAALASALNSLIADRDLASRLAEAGKTHFQASFSEEPVIAMYLDLCRQLKEDYAWRTKALLGTSVAQRPNPRPRDWVRGRSVRSALPLTLSLSQRERDAFSTAAANLPLPRGEGWVRGNAPMADGSTAEPKLLLALSGS